jgi:hypothetical protein
LDRILVDINIDDLDSEDEALPKEPEPLRLPETLQDLEEFSQQARFWHNYYDLLDPEERNAIRLAREAREAEERSDLQDTMASQLTMTPLSITTGDYGLPRRIAAQAATVKS